MTDEPESTGGRQRVGRELGRFAEDIARDWTLRGAMLFGVLILFGLPSAGAVMRVVTVAVSVAGIALPILALAKKCPDPVSGSSPSVCSSPNSPSSWPSASTDPVQCMISRRSWRRIVYGTRGQSGMTSRRLG
ncbi:hypothetical protein BH24ACT5_BH24ACT5_14400 [soil metagenome]